MNSLSMGKYRPAVILTLALTVFLASCTGTSDDPVTTPKTSTWMVSTIAGDTLVGDDIQSELNSPAGVAVDSDNNVVYVADTENHLIRKIEMVWRAGWKVTTIAGSGTATASGENPDNAVATAATFNFPSGVVVDSSGNLYVADMGNNLIRKITSAGVVTTLAGSGTEGYHDATGTEAQFNGPLDVAVDSSDNLYVVDTGNNCIRKIVISTREVTTFAGRTGMSGMGSADGAGLTEAQFGFPTGVAVDSSGNVYVADYFNHLIRKITPAGAVSTLAGTGTAGSADTVAATDSTAAVEATFDSPSGVAVDSSGELYVADADNNRIRKITITTSNNVETATVTTIAGDGTAAIFDSPVGVAVDSSGNVYVADYSNNRIRKIIRSPGRLW